MLRCAEYGIYERTLIFSLKYNGKKYIARDIAAMMKDRLALAGVDYDVIVPVPMNHDKEQTRGFNQTSLIGKYLAKATGKDFSPGALRRTKNTAPMRGLSPTEREINVRGCFVADEKCREKLRGRRVLLLDDFYTTGATALECYRAMTPDEPADVIFIAFAAKY
ncbi:ComF family protein [Aminicella lysinilytica]|uniref:ComF family protein n=1 Tax=Aminicella lysinilytica TaxID=433323 RepID=A0A4R6Q657_9FIRM|nr:ComF family protein [Aminicella lysinilytica]TDP57914.1 ComF family protein [Aminicella lysinilytica]